MQNRDTERIIFQKTDLKNADTLILKYSNDEGVIKNTGRRGSEFSPEAILNVFKKLTYHSSKSWAEHEVAANFTYQNFNELQKIIENNLSQLFKSELRAENFIHLGGGHDHVYPILSLLKNQNKKIIIINIDAHCDTRTDLNFHSGTPFRQFSNEYSNFTLIQLGIHEFANSISTRSPLLNGTEKIETYNNLKNKTKNFNDIQNFLNKEIPFENDAIYFLSLDADAIDSSIMEGVSAVNHSGLPLHFIEEIFIYAKNILKCQHFGIYEYNPVYDNLSQKGARALSNLMYSIYQ